MNSTLNNDQQAALETLKGAGNVFVTGAAGSGKSYLIRQFLKDQNIPILASTGAAAILVGGRTFHSFFGLGIMEGGFQETVERALRNGRLLSRLKKTEAVIIDEISMISGPTLAAAEAICRRVRGEEMPWGGMRIIAVGDFAQLPPVNPHQQKKEWAFLDPVWEKTQFQNVVLGKIMRTVDVDFLKVLNEIRTGVVSEGVEEFLNSRLEKAPQGDLTRLFPHRKDVDDYNLKRLEKINKPLHSFETSYMGKAKDIENFRKNSPISDLIQVKEEALVMLRQNDPEQRWVNGSLGLVKKISKEFLTIQLLSGRTVDVKKTTFTLLDADGQPVVAAENFPVSLAWAMTIHKAQGATLDRMHVNLRKLWEPGQAYVAISRARSPEGLYIEEWSKSAIFSDAEVTKFHTSINTH